MPASRPREICFFLFSGGATWRQAPLPASKRSRPFRNTAIKALPREPAEFSRTTRRVARPGICAQSVIAALSRAGAVSTAPAPPSPASSSRVPHQYSPISSTASLCSLSRAEACTAAAKAGHASQNSNGWAPLVGHGPRSGMADLAAVQQGLEQACRALQVRTLYTLRHAGLRSVVASVHSATQHSNDTAVHGSTALHSQRDA